MQFALKELLTALLEEIYCNSIKAASAIRHLCHEKDFIFYFQ